MSPRCPQCNFPVLAHDLDERLAYQALDRLNVGPAEVLKCPVSDLWHIVELGGTGQLDMLETAA